MQYRFATNEERITHCAITPESLHAEPVISSLTLADKVFSERCSISQTQNWRRNSEGGKMVTVRE
jgi:hypothetical protein